MASPPPAELSPDENKGYIINIISWIGVVISSLFVVLRLYSRAFIIRSLGWDDAIMVFAAILHIITVVLSTIAVSYGVGRHVYYLSNDDMTNSLYYVFILRPIGISAYCLPKLAVVILIIKLMATKKRGAWFLYSVIAILFITSAISFIPPCDPADHFWHPSEPADCWPNPIWASTTFLSAGKYRLTLSTRRI